MAKKSLKYAKTTDGVLKAYSQAYRKWDKQLNNVYKMLIKRIPDKDKEILRDSQRKWIAFRDSEFKFMSRHIYRGGGSITQIIAADRRAALIRSRVIELEAYVVIFDSPP